MTAKEKNGFYRWYKIMLLMDDYGKEMIIKLNFINSNSLITCEQKIEETEKVIQTYFDTRANMLVELQKMDISKLENLLGLD